MKVGNNSFVMYESFYNSILEMDEDKHSEAFKALIEFGLYNNEGYSDDPIIKIMLHVAKQNIVSSKKKYDKAKNNGEKGASSGVLGGRPEKITLEDVLDLKNKGYKQIEVSTILGVSLSTVKRKWGNQNLIVSKPIQVNQKSVKRYHKVSKLRCHLGVTRCHKSVTRCHKSVISVKRCQNPSPQTIGITNKSEVSKPLNVNVNYNVNDNDNVFKVMTPKKDIYPKNEYIFKILYCEELLEKYKLTLRFLTDKKVYVGFIDVICDKLQNNDTIVVDEYDKVNNVIYIKNYHLDKDFIFKEDNINNEDDILPF